MKQYNGVNVDWISEWILAHLKESETWEPTSSIVAALSMYDGITEHKVRRRLRKLRNAGLVECDQETRENVEDANLYQPNSHAVKQLGGISRPRETDADVREYTSEVEELRIQNNRLKSNVRELRSELELLQNHFNSRGSERIARIEEHQEYLMEHADVEKRRWDTLERLLEEHDLALVDYFKNSA